MHLELQNVLVNRFNLGEYLKTLTQSQAQIPELRLSTPLSSDEVLTVVNQAKGIVDSAWSRVALLPGVPVNANQNAQQTYCALYAIYSGMSQITAELANGSLSLVIPEIAAVIMEAGYTIVPKIKWMFQQPERYQDVVAQMSKGYSKLMAVVDVLSHINATQIQNPEQLVQLVQQLYDKNVLTQQEAEHLFNLQLQLPQLQLPQLATRLSEFVIEALSFIYPWGLQDAPTQDRTLVINFQPDDPAGGFPDGVDSVKFNFNNPDVNVSARSSFFTHWHTGNTGNILINGKPDWMEMKQKRNVVIYLHGHGAPEGFIEISRHANDLPRHSWLVE